MLRSRWINHSQGTSEAALRCCEWASVDILSGGQMRYSPATTVWVVAEVCKPIERYNRKENLNPLWTSCQKNKCKICEEEVKRSAVQICLNPAAGFFDLERNKDRWRELALQRYWPPPAPTRASKTEQIPAQRAAERDPDFPKPISRWSSVMVTSQRGCLGLRKAGQHRRGTSPARTCTALGQTCSKLVYTAHIYPQRCLWSSTTSCLEELLVPRTVRKLSTLLRASLLVLFKGRFQLI